MAAIESLFSGSNKLTDIFGYWPSFHDAEVIELHLWRGEVEPDEDRYVFPILTVKLHVWEWINKSDGSGCLSHNKDTLTTLRFYDLDEDLRIEGFNHQNAIFELKITQQNRANGPSPFFSVQFQQSFGMGAIFKCHRIEVMEAVPRTNAGDAVG